jgi:hypothetical protein
MTALIFGFTCSRARERLVEQLGRAHLAFAHEFGEPERVVATIFREGHRGSVIRGWKQQ